MGRLHFIDSQFKDKLNPAKWQYFLLNLPEMRAVLRAYGEFNDADEMENLGKYKCCYINLRLNKCMS